MARPTKLSEQTMAHLTQAISMGASYELACKYAGITYQTFNNWMKQGEKGKDGTEARKLYDAVTYAEGEAAVKWLAKIEKAASEGTWQAAAWKLERRYPEQYGRQVTDMRHSGKVDVGKLSDDELRAIIES